MGGHKFKMAEEEFIENYGQKVTLKIDYKMVFRGVKNDQIWVLKNRC
jgi:hypothetical protein